MTRHRSRRIRFDPRAVFGDPYEPPKTELIRGRGNAQYRWEDQHRVPDWLTQYGVVCAGCLQPQELFVVEGRHPDQRTLLNAVVEALEAAHLCSGGTSRMVLVGAAPFPLPRVGEPGQSERLIHDLFVTPMTGEPTEPWFLFDRSRYRLGNHMEEGFDRGFMRRGKRLRRITEDSIRRRLRRKPPDADTRQRVLRALGTVTP